MEIKYDSGFWENSITESVKVKRAYFLHGDDISKNFSNRNIQAGELGHLNISGNQAMRDESNLMEIPSLVCLNRLIIVAGY